MEIYKARLAAFGFNAIVVDGHKVEELIEAFGNASATKDKPTAIICQTYKGNILCSMSVQLLFYFSIGKGFPNVEDLLDWHGKPLGDKAESALAAVNGRIKNHGPHGIKPLPFVDDAPKVDLTKVKLSEPPNYKIGGKVSTQ